MNLSGVIIKHWLKIMAGLLIGSLLVLVVVVFAILFYCAWVRERASGNANTLASEFKGGATSLNFLDRAKQLGADELSTNFGEWEIGDNDRFDQFNAKYKTLLEGRVFALFKAGPFERDICEITFKQGKVLKAEVRHLD